MMCEHIKNILESLFKLKDNPIDFDNIILIIVKINYLSFILQNKLSFLILKTTKSKS